MTTWKRTIALGTMTFGTSVDGPGSFAVLDRFAELGGTVLDTADNYAFWAEGATGDESETVVGDWLASRGQRDSMVIGTKGGARPTVPGTGLETAEGLSAAALTAAAEGSLRRLRTDHIDVYWTHIQDPAVPAEETVGALASLVDSGKAVALGASNHSVWRVERARALAGDGPRYTHLQYRDSYLQPRSDVALPVAGQRHVTPELREYIRSEGDLTLWVYSSLLSGGYTRTDVELPAVYDHPGTPPRLAALREVADELEATANQVVLAWLLDRDPPTLPIVGASRTAQVEEAMGALELRLSEGQRERLERAGG
ncbi:aldo/keto reductase [Streptomyces katsurahamanus]|uniref:Aldo/keto reductase n=1 Tax=Streptomyces katsurahamanus TaxID=2577098 RepID=A0ABW9NWK6_9ACTN|nr:aldo/keto reductase [Streptomyces katsurahamanus]MQS37526.1 aldo/keto reductase [Streptomyces katsurahamanus]